MLRCRDVTRKIASGEIEEASLWTRLEVRVHLWMCRHCRSYEEQMRALGETARRLVARKETPPPDVPQTSDLAETADDRLERELLERIEREARPPQN